MFNIISKAAAVAALSILPISASALTLTFEEGVGTLVTIVDGGAGDLDGVVDGAILAGVTTAGGATASITTSLVMDENGESSISLGVLNATAGALDLNINASHEGFGAAAFDPDESLIGFSLNAGSISGSLTGTGMYDNSNGLFAGTAIGPAGTVTNSTDDIIQSVKSVLSDPFSLSIMTTVAAGTTVQYDAKVTVSTVPLPAGALLMGTALAGFGIARRRRKAA